MATRGIRNNNPLNIRHGQKWVGLAPVQTDKSFDQFITMEYGIRAAFKLIKKYIEDYNCNTITKIINKWAPSIENDTKNYIKVVSQKSGYSADYLLTFSNKDAMTKIVSAMIQMENSETVSMLVIERAYSLI